jgi:hypothetical protein
MVFYLSYDPVPNNSECIPGMGIEDITRQPSADAAKIVKEEGSNAKNDRVKMPNGKGMTAYMF